MEIIIIIIIIVVIIIIIEEETKTEVILKMQLKWIGHLCRMNSNLITQIVYEEEEDIEQNKIAKESN